MTTTEPYVCNAQDAAKIADWLQNRGGILIWRSVNLSNPSASWTTPATTTDGQPYPKPTWQVEDRPERHITSISDVETYTTKEVKSFHVGVKQGDSFNFVVTDASTRKIRKEVEKAKERYGKDAWYVFDYGAYENCVILIEDSKIPLAQWLEQQQQ